MTALVVFLVCVVGWGRLYWLGCDAYADGRWRAGDWYHGVGLACIGVGFLLLWLTIFARMTGP